MASGSAQPSYPETLRSAGIEGAHKLKELEAAVQREAVSAARK